jgi:voltage-gated potassium channel
MNKYLNDKNKYIWLLLSLFALMALLPFRQIGMLGAGLLSKVLYTLVLFIGLYTCRKNKKIMIVMAVLASSSFLATWLDSIVLDYNISLYLSAASLFYFIYLLRIAKDIFDKKEASANLLSGSLCIYILFGIGFAYLYTLLEVQAPGSFKLPERLSGIDVNELNYETLSPLLGTFIYFSFVTLSTLGYGDIHAETLPAQFLSLFEAICGQIYLVVIVAGMVGMHSAKFFIKDTINK